MRLHLLALPLLPLLHASVIDNAAYWAFDHAQSVITNEDEGGGTTIWGKLQDDDKFSKLVKVLKFEKTTIKELDDKKVGITFFAVNDEGLKRPHDDDDKNLMGGSDWFDGDFNFDNGNWPSLAHISHTLETEPAMMEEDDDMEDDGDDQIFRTQKGKGGDKDKKRRRKIFKKIVRAVLQYHMLPLEMSGLQLAQNSTVATCLKPHDGSGDGLARRIHLQKHLVPPSLVVNFYATVQGSTDAANGKLHELNHPLLPPGSIFDGMFFAAKYLSITSSALQAVYARGLVDYHGKHKGHKHASLWSGSGHGTPLATAFAPSNDAWEALPPRLRFFLFSPFGRCALGAVLKYHYVPHTLVHAELVHHEKHGHDHAGITTFEDDDPSFHREIEVPSGLGKDAKLKIVLDKTVVLPIEGATKTTIKVNDVDARIIDIPARNGAWHVLDRVLCPPHKHKKPHDEAYHPDGEWAGWEQWLPEWVAAQEPAATNDWARVLDEIENVF